MQSIDEAIFALRQLGVRPEDALAGRASVPAVPGLYAVHGDDQAWSELGFGDRPDGRPLYVGMSASSLLGRDVGEHFCRRRADRTERSGTGHSTLRRSLAALLADPLALVAVPRNLASPGHFANFGLEAAGDDSLTTWMFAKLTLAVWAAPTGWNKNQIRQVEKEALRHFRPPLNLTDVDTEWRREIKARRRVLADQARTWRRQMTAT